MDQPSMGDNTSKEGGKQTRKTHSSVDHSWITPQGGERSSSSARLTAVESSF